MLDREAWLKEIESVREETEFLLDKPVFEEKGDCELFTAIIKIFLDYRVTVILNPQN